MIVSKETEDEEDDEDEVVDALNELPIGKLVDVIKIVERVNGVYDFNQTKVSWWGHMTVGTQNIKYTKMLILPCPG